MRGKEAEFRREVFALNMIDNLKHPNILPLLAAYQHGDKYNMIFPYAERNLKNYWETKEPPRSPDSIMEFLGEIFALAAGLGSIHKIESTNETNHCGYHRDIKPTNILNTGKKFMIADFGLALFRPLTYHDTCKSNSSGVDFNWGLSTYRAPECGGNRMKASRASDIWSLGCVFAEVLAFLIWGKAGPKKFSDMRKEETSTNGGFSMPVDWFHDGTDLKKSVLNFFELTKMNGGLISETTRIVKLMLRKEESKRLKADELLRLLREALSAEERRLQSPFSSFQPRPVSESLPPHQRPHDPPHSQTNPSTPVSNPINRPSPHNVRHSIDGSNVSSLPNPRKLDLPTRVLDQPGTDPNSTNLLEYPKQRSASETPRMLQHIKMGSSMDSGPGDFLQSPQTATPTLSRNSSMHRKKSIGDALRELRKQDTVIRIFGV